MSMHGKRMQSRLGACAAQLAQARAAEVVPPAERVEVPEGESLPDELRAMRKGTDLFISFSSASMSAFALNWVANLKMTGITQILVGALDEQMMGACAAAGESPYVPREKKKKKSKRPTERTR